MHRQSDWERPQQGDEDLIRCQQCAERVYFRTRDEEIAHRLEKMEAGEGHWTCERCGLPFNSEAGYYEHMQRRHNDDQNHLPCPGCSKSFKAISTLMAHIEGGECPNVKVGQIHARREEKLKFHTALLERQEGYDPIAPPPVSDRPIGFSTGGSLVPLTANNLSMHASQNLRPSHASSSHPNMVPFARGVGIRLAEEDSSPGDLVNNEHHPDSPSFDVGQYYRAGTFKCPHERCYKVFNTAHPFIAHLRSAAHNRKDRLACPQCGRWFNSLTALAGHVETGSRRCGVKQSGDHGSIVNLLTAGMVDVQTDRRDGTMRYSVAPDARETFNAEARAERERAERAMHDRKAAKAEERERFWETKKGDLLW